MQASQETHSKMVIKTFPVGPLQCNCTIIADPISKEAIVVDPGGDADRILAILNEEGFQVRQILHTHAHFDHFLAAGAIHEATGAPIALHQADQFLWEHLEDQCRLFNMSFEPVPNPTHWLEDEEPISISHLKGKALHTPGHTPGSMSFWFDDEKLLLAGDTLFKGSVGRTDLWGGDYQTIEHSIRHKLYTLDEATKVVTGHGPSTTIGEEVRHNAFIRGIA